MDAPPQDPNTISENRVDSDVALEPRSSQDIQHDPSLPEKLSPRAKAKEQKMPPMTEDFKGVEGSDNETKTPKEAQPPSSEPASPLKKRPGSTRESLEIFRSPSNDDDDCKSKQSSPSAGDRSSIHTVDSIDDRRLSDKMKKAWREVRGQSRLDPLEQWMVKHSGGTFKEKPRHQTFGESSDK
ncbi:hypothetical protein F5Y12DRAFT_322252 [Xylaria sp. FL1777]|nr:hypothetical protein F5Y12DRAFT_322252 [Xylaria sp. FL1777]